MPQRGHAGLIIPVATTGATLGLALSQYPIFNAFQKQPQLAGRPQARFFHASLSSKTWLILGLSLTSATAGLLSSRWLHTHSTLETTSVSRWYLYGSVLALGHAMFVPLITREIKLQVENSDSGKSDAEVEELNAQSMQRWVLWHTLRTFTVDLGAVVCFAEGVAQGLWIV